MQRYKHILFDIDGTLIDSFELDMGALMELLRRHRPNQEYSKADLAEVFGIPGKDGLKKLGFAESEIPALIQEWLDIIDELDIPCVLFPNALEVLAFLKKQGYKIALVTSRGREEIFSGPLAGCFPEVFRPYVDLAISSSDTKRPKPFPDPLWHYMELTQAKPEEILFVGDAPTDLQCADSAGVDFALALWGYHGKKHLYCKYYLNNLFEVINIASTPLKSDGSAYLSSLLHNWARELNALGQIGLTYTKDNFDKERFQRLQCIACEMASQYIDDTYENIKKDWCRESGYKTPQIDTRAAIFDEQGRILMVKEALSKKWNLPGGWCDDNLSLVENTIKEVREEAGMEVHAKKLIAILDRNRHNKPESLHGCLKVFMECSHNVHHFQANIETLDLRYFAKEELESLVAQKQLELRESTCTLQQILMCFVAHHDDKWTAIIE